MDGLNTILALGRDESKEARFQFRWRLRPEEILEIIRKRISGATESIRQKCLVPFPGQTPQQGNLKIDHYPVVELGSGAFGQVWKTVDAYSGDMIAVKLITRPKNDPRNGRWERMVANTRDREVFLLSRYRHHYIVPYLGSQGWDTDSVQIFMPVKSGTLMNLVFTNPSFDQVVEIGNAALLQMLSALDFLAHHGLIHRDVKPENILYDRDHLGAYHFQLADFGLSTLQSVARSAVGTPNFVAPEIDDGNMPQTSKADIWSLFVTMLWVFNEDLFRHRIEMGELLNALELRRAILSLAVNNENLRFIRDMGIVDPEYRASAAQQLARWGRQDLMTTTGVMLPEDTQFDRWMDAIYSGQSKISDNLMDIITNAGGNR
ncbi:kinase-like domain-containing protein [Hypoxylon crocopeplum]|nr:kinase-like domain-containing protein [Hypoxylon crocopeplum]